MAPRAIMQPLTIGPDLWTALIHTDTGTEHQRDPRRSHPNRDTRNHKPATAPTSTEITHPYRPRPVMTPDTGARPKHTQMLVIKSRMRKRDVLFQIVADTGDCAAKGNLVVKLRKAAPALGRHEMCSAVGTPEHRTVGSIGEAARLRQQRTTGKRRMPSRRR